MKIYVTLIFCFIVLVSKGQFYYDLTSEPDSAEVFLNDKKVGNTPMRLNYYWSAAKKGKIVIKVAHNGYKTWADTITEKPRDFGKNKDITFKREIPDFANKEIINLFAFDKVVANFKDGTPIGTRKFNGEDTEKLKWDGDIKVGDDDFPEAFYEIFAQASIPTPYSENAELFKDENYKPNKLPRYIIGTEIVKYHVEIRERKSKVAGDKVVTTKINFNWNLLDKAKNEVVLNYNNTIETRFRTYTYGWTDNNLETFKSGLVAFLESEDFGLLLDDKTNLVASLINVETPTAINIGRLQPMSFESRSQMIKSTSKACVTIITDKGHGSGVIISEDGLLLTANHVIEGVNRIDVKLSSGITLKAKLVSSSAANDIAILDLDGSGFAALSLYEEEAFDLGEEVITIGTPAEISLGQSVAMGVLSGKRLVEEKVYLQTDIALNPGNSGGPLINEKGQVIGIVQRKIVGTSYEGIGFAIPIYKVVEYLGLSILSE